MENFIAYNPVRLYFGKGVLSELSKEATKIGKTALLIYGKGSVIRNGIFSVVEDSLKSAKIKIVEYGGIKPNPCVHDVDKAIQLGRENDVDMVIGLGGGSVIDSAKIVAACIPDGLNGWDVMKGKSHINSALPIITILTLVATGTEMNRFAVLQNQKERDKIGFGHNLIYPKCSFLDPEFTFTVNREHTSYGIVDLIAHALENFFGIGEAHLSDRFVISIIKEAMIIAPMLLENPNDYELRARVMWASTNALNGNTSYGRKKGDFAVHAFGHTLSLLFDLPHAATLSIVYPAWLKYLEIIIPDRLKMLGGELFGCEDANGFVSGITEFFESVNCPVSLLEVGIDLSERDRIKELWIEKNIQGNAYPVTHDDYDFLLDIMFGITV